MRGLAHRIESAISATGNLVQIINRRKVRVREKITSQNWRPDLVQVLLIRESKTTGIASYFEVFESEVSAKDGLKLRCKNVKLFLREPLGLGTK